MTGDGQKGFLVGDPQGVVLVRAPGYTDVPAAHKTILFQHPLHDPVIWMRIDLQIAALFQCPVKTERSGAFPAPVGSDPVDDSIGRVVEPAPVGDILIILFCAKTVVMIIEDSCDLSL